LPIPKRCEFRNHNEIPNNLPKQKKSVRWQNYAKTNQANENITATKSGQDTRSAAQWVGFDSRVVGVGGATNAVLNRHQLGIKLLFFVIVFAASWQHDNLFFMPFHQDEGLAERRK